MPLVGRNSGRQYPRTISKLFGHCWVFGGSKLRLRLGLKGFVNFRQEATFKGDGWNFRVPERNQGLAADRTQVRRPRSHGSLLAFSEGVFYSRKQVWFLQNLIQLTGIKPSSAATSAAFQLTLSEASPSQPLPNHGTFDLTTRSLPAKSRTRTSTVLTFAGSLLRSMTSTS